MQKSVHHIGNLQVVRMLIKVTSDVRMLVVTYPLVFYFGRFSFEKHGAWMQVLFYLEYH